VDNIRILFILSPFKLGNLLFKKQDIFYILYIIPFNDILSIPEKNYVYIGLLISILKYYLCIDRGLTGVCEFWRRFQYGFVVTKIYYII